jgi:hypothetical protein
MNKYVKIRTAKFALSECLLDGLVFIATRGKKYPSALSQLAPGLGAAFSAIKIHGTEWFPLETVPRVPTNGEALNTSAKPRKKPHCLTCHKPMKGHGFAICPKNAAGQEWQAATKNMEDVVEVSTYFNF